MEIKTRPVYSTITCLLNDNARLLLDQPTNNLLRQSGDHISFQPSLDWTSTKRRIVTLSKKDQLRRILSNLECDSKCAILL
jgi:hypothetical protein